MKQGTCKVCGQDNCSCENVLAMIRCETSDTPTERKRIERFRSRVRDEARKRKRGLI